MWFDFIQIFFCFFLSIHFALSEPLVSSDLDKLIKFSTGPNNRELLKYSDCQYERTDFQNIVQSATAAMDFFDRHLDGLVLDAAIGTRIMESQLMMIRAGHPKLPQGTQMYLMTLQFKSELLSDEIADKFKGILMENELTEKEILSLSRQLAWVDNATLWESPQKHEWTAQEIPTKAINSPLNSTQEIMNEDISDQCISGLFNSCFVTDSCAQLFMKAPHSMYSLTHQVIFFLIARKMKCFTRAEFKSKTPSGDPKEFLGTLCQRTWAEANDIEANGFPKQFRDLLAEQITVCSLAGYSNFLKRDWLTKILSWQSTDENLGCFVDFMAETPAPSDSISARTNSKLSKSDFSGGRRLKRADEMVQVGQTKCSVHFTAVSLGALGMHLRFFADTCLSSH